MQVQVYNFSKRYNSTKKPAGGNTVDCVLKDNTSVFNPVFIFNFDAYSYNYLKWGNRYYYISDITYIANNLYEISCNIDIMATWRDDVLGSTQFVDYSQTSFDDGVIDNRISNIDTASITQSSAEIISGSGNTYILSCASGGGIAGAYYLTRTQLNNLMANLNVGTIGSGIIDNMVKEFGGAYDSIFKCVYVPFNWIGQTIGAGSIKLGSYDTGIVGNNPILLWEYECNISIPWQYNDFRNRSPYTSIIMYLPSVGNIELNPDDFIGQGSINIKLAVDGITGYGRYIVGGKYSYPCNFSTEIAVTVNNTNSIGAVTSLVGNVASGNFNLASNLSNVITASGRNVGVIGSLGGQGITKVSPGTWTNVYLYVISHNTNVEPSNLAGTIGRPCFSSHAISSLSGYCQTSNASVDCNAPDELKQEINNIMNGGFFIE